MSRRRPARMPSRPAGAFARWAFALVVVLAAVFASGERARADTRDEAVIASPRDAPLVLRPETIHTPKIPATYQEKDLGWLLIAYPPGAHERVAPLIIEAEAVKAKLADELGQSVLDHVEVRVGRNFDEMTALAPAELAPPAYASGVAYPPLHLVVLSLTAPVGAEATDLGEVFRHELSHVALEDAVLGHHVPRWFNEGLAIRESGEHPWLRRQTLWDATLSKSVIPLADIDRSFPEEHYEASIAYAESGDFVRFLLREDDRARFGSLVDRVRSGQPFERALGDAYSTDLRKLEFQWREEIAHKYTFWPMLLSGSLLWVIAIVVLAFAYVKKRRRDKATLARWEREDAAAMEAALAVPSDAATDAAAMHPEAVRSVGLPKIEHDGGWHTLH